MTSKQKKRHAAAQQRYAQRQPPEWVIWKCMKRRCYDRSSLSWPFYGGRGITVCDRWLVHGFGFKNFLADMGSMPSKEYSLDRIDPDGNYCKENCRWLLKSINCGTSRGCYRSGNTNCNHGEEEHETQPGL